MRTTNKNRLVYSSDNNGLCQSCNKRLDRCRCESATETLSQDNKVVLGRSSKGRGGKPVTTISGIPLPKTELKALAKQLKTQCGVGGSINQSVIELQGEQREKVKILLANKGWKIVISGS